MELGLMIEQIRKEKNISVKELCGTHLSKASYSRFIKGNSMISAEMLLYFLSKFRITFAMFMQDYQNYFQLKYDYTMLNNAVSLDKQSYILKLIRLYSKKESLSNAEAVFKRTIELVYQFATKHTLDLSLLQESQRYFESITFWSDYDYKSLKNLMPLLETNFIRYYLMKSISEIENLSDPLLPEELFYNLSQLYLRLLKEKQTTQAEEIFSIITQLFIDQQDIGKKIYLAFCEGLSLLFIDGDEKGHQQIVQVIQYMRDLMMGKRIDEFINHYELIKEAYALHIQ